MPPPRPWEEEVAPWEALEEGKPYRVKVLSVRKRKRRGQMQTLVVVFEHLDAEHAGRKSETELPLPFRPDNLATRLFRALGFATAVGCTVRPRDAIGASLICTFGPSQDGRDPEPVAFAPIQEDRDAEHHG